MAMTLVGTPDRRPNRSERLAREAERRAQLSEDQAARQTLRSIRREVFEAEIRMDAIEFLAEHVMDKIVEIDDYRIFRAAGDPLKNRLLAEAEATANMQLRREQRNLFAYRDFE